MRKELLSELIKQLKRIDKSIEIIIVNDGSTDQTKFILEQETRINIVSNKLNRGKGYSLKRGAKLAKNHNLVLIDGDLEVSIKEIPFFN